MPDKSSNIPSSIVCSAIGAESLRNARASNNPELFSTAIKLIIARISQQGEVERLFESIVAMIVKIKQDYNFFLRH